MKLSIWNNLGREKGKDEHGRDDLDRQGLLEELPRDGHVIGPAYVGDEEVRELDGGQGDGGGGEAGAELERPEERVTVLVLRGLGQLEHRVPQLTLRWLLYEHGHRRRRRRRRSRRRKLGLH